MIEFENITRAFADIHKAVLSLSGKLTDESQRDKLKDFALKLSLVEHDMQGIRDGTDNGKT